MVIPFFRATARDSRRTRRRTASSGGPLLHGVQLFTRWVNIPLQPLVRHPAPYAQLPVALWAFGNSTAGIGPSGPKCPGFEDPRSAAVPRPFRWRWSTNSPVHGLTLRQLAGQVGGSSSRRRSSAPQIRFRRPTAALIPACHLVSKTSASPEGLPRSQEAKDRKSSHRR